MADIKKIKIGENTYNIKDEEARALIDTKQDAISYVDVDDSQAASVGTPEVTAVFADGQMTFAFKNLKGEKGDTGAKGDKGDKGDSVMVAQGDLPLTHVLGQDYTSAMSQKGVTDAIENATSTIADLSSEFFFTDGLCIAHSSGVQQSSTSFAASDAVDVSDYAGWMLRITMPRYTKSGGGATGYGLTFYNANNARVASLGIETYSSGDRTVIKEVAIPSNAAKIRTTFWKSDSSYYQVPFSAKAVRTIKDDIASTKTDVANLHVADSEIMDAVDDTIEELAYTNAKIDGGYHELGINLTDQFTFSTSGYYNSSGAITSSTYFAVSNAVDISDYQGLYLRVAIPRWNSSTAGYLGGNLLICDGNDNIIASRYIRKFSDSASVKSKGDVQIYEVYIPEGAAIVKTTFFKSQYTQFITQPFVCRIVENVTGVKEVMDSISDAALGEQGETEILDVTWTSDRAIYAGAPANVLSATGQSASGNIDVSAYSIIRVTVNCKAVAPTTGCAFYDANGVVLRTHTAVFVDEGEDTLVMRTYRVPPTAKYFRTTIKTALLGGFKMYGYGENLSSNLIDVKDRLLYPIIGSPRIYHSAPTVNETPFTDVASVYDAWDGLVTAHPDWIARKADIGNDQSDTFAIRHYEFGWQHRDANTSRTRSGTNYWNDKRMKVRRILLNLGTHANEGGALLAGYLSIKEIIESTEEWAQFIKANFIIDVIPLLNPWGFENKGASGYGRETNSDGVNINRDFNALAPVKDYGQQAETIACIGLIQSLIPLGLIGCIDLHNTGGMGVNDQSYLVSNSKYEFYELYARLAMQIQGMMYDTLNAYFNSVGEHFHMWDTIGESGATGQLHWYMDKIGLLGVTCEVAPATGTGYQKAAQISKDYCINLIQTFGTMI